MPHAKNGKKQSILETMLDEASWLITHADALTVYGRTEEAAAEWLRAAVCEREIACLLEADKQDIEAAVHYVSAASCFAQIQQFDQAVPLLRSALSFSLRDAYRADVEKILRKWLPKAKKQVHHDRRKHPTSAVS